MFTRIDREVWRQYAVSALAVAVTVAAIFVGIDLAQKASGEFGGGVSVIEYYFWKLPEFVLPAMPAILVIAASWVAVGFRRSNECIALYAAGIPANRYLRPLYLATLLMSVGLVFANDWLADVHSRASRERGVGFASSSYLGMRLGIDRDGVNYLVGSFHVPTGNAYNITLIAHDPSFQVAWELAARKAVWTYIDPSITAISGSANPGAARDEEFVSVTASPGYRWVFSDGQVSDGFGGLRPLALGGEWFDAIALTAADLLPSDSIGAGAAISQAERAVARNPQDVAARVTWNRAIGMPMSTVLVMLVAVPLLFVGENPNPYVAGAVALGVAAVYYALFFGAQAVAGMLPPHDMPSVDLMIWSPAALFLGLGCWLNARIPS